MNDIVNVPTRYTSLDLSQRFIDSMNESGSEFH